MFEVEEILVFGNLTIGGVTEFSAALIIFSGTFGAASGSGTTGSGVGGVGTAVIFAVVVAVVDVRLQLPASVPPKAKFEIFTVFAVPTSLFSNAPFAVVTDKLSVPIIPTNDAPALFKVAFVVPSYTLFSAVIPVIVIAFGVIVNFPFVNVTSQFEFNDPLLLIAYPVIVFTFSPATLVRFTPKSSLPTFEPVVIAYANVGSTSP